MTIFWEPNHQNFIFSHSLASTSFPCQSTAPSYPTDSLLYASPDFHFFPKKQSPFSQAEVFYWSLNACQILGSHWGHSSEWNRRDICCVLSLLCFTSGGRPPKSHVSKINFPALQLAGFGSNSGTLYVSGWKGQRKELVDEYMTRNRRPQLQAVVTGGRSTRYR